MPIVSVIMPMYNSVDFVRQAIDSILQQTFADLEIIAINDGSTDGCADVVSQINDERLTFIDRENHGFVNTLNECIELAKGKYIARLDDDDWSYPDRIKKQVEYFEAHPDTVLVGTLCDEYRDGQITKVKETPVRTPNQIRFGLIFGNFAFAHSSFMMRRDVLIYNSIRYEVFKQVPDYHMITQLYPYGKIARIQEPLVVYRIHGAQSTQVRSSRMKQDESDNARAWFVDTLPLNAEEKRAVKKGILRKLKTKGDIESFDAVIEKYKDLCGIDRIKDKECIGFLYDYCMLTQFCSPSLLASFIRCSKRKWLLSSKGLKFAIKCILKRNPAYLETTVEI